MRKIAMILHTNGLQYDDRIRKEMLSVMKIYPDIKFKIFAIIDSEHHKFENGVTEYNVEYEIPFLKTRVQYKPGTHLLQKAWDFYKTVKPKLKDFDAIWCADFDILFFILLVGKPKIWDMHELPTIFLGNCIKKRILKFLMNRCNIIVHANPERLQYLKNQNALSNIDNQRVIRNFPLKENLEYNINTDLQNFLDWKGGAACVYIQGVNNYDRCDFESIEAIMRIPNLKAVVIGKFKDSLKAKFESLYKEEFRKKIFFVGMIPQKKTSLYIRNCELSLILYRNTEPNNFYCEPNRMFQSIMNGCPVVVGVNPPMKELVNLYGFGEVLEDDGTDIAGIVNGLQTVLKNRDKYCSNIQKYKDRIEWEKQEDEFKVIINKTFQKR